MMLRYRLLSRLKQIKVYRSLTSQFVLPKFTPRKTVPFTLGFSLLTLIGFEKKLSSEDELILTIKHCVLFIQRNEHDKAEQLLHVALRQAQQMGHQLGITYIYDVMANLALEREQYDKAKDLFVAVTQRIMSDGATEDDPRVVHISVKLARISHMKKEYTTAQLGYDWCLQKLNNLLSSDPSDTNKQLYAMAEDWYGRLFLDCDKHDLGLTYMKNALDIMKDLSNLEPEHLVIQLNDIGTVYDKLGKIDESIDYFGKAIDLGKKIPEMSDLGAIYVNLGRAYIKKNLLEMARKSCGFGWRLGFTTKNEDIKQEAERCLKEIKNLA